MSPGPPAGPLETSFGIHQPLCSQPECGSQICKRQDCRGRVSQGVVLFLSLKTHPSHVPGVLVKVQCPHRVPVPFDYQVQAEKEILSLFASTGHPFPLNR